MTSGLRQSILNLIANGLTDIQIAERLGVTRNSVIGHRHRAGVEANRRQAIAPGAALPAGQKFPNWKGGIGARAAEPRQPSGACKWIDGDPRAKWSYCNQPVSHVGSAWCAPHRRRVYAGPAVDRTPEQQAAINSRMARARAAKEASA